MAAAPERAEPGPTTAEAQEGVQRPWWRKVFGGSKSVCDCEERFRSVCKGLPSDNEHDSKHYCVLHLPDKDKNLDKFGEAVAKKVKDKDFDFRGVYFPAS